MKFKYLQLIFADFAYGGQCNANFIIFASLFVFGVTLLRTQVRKSVTETLVSCRSAKIYRRFFSPFYPLTFHRHLIVFKIILFLFQTHGASCKAQSHACICHTESAGLLQFRQPPSLLQRVL